MWRISFCGHSGHFTTNVVYEVRYLTQSSKKFTLKISSDMIKVVGYFGQSLTYPIFLLLGLNFKCIWVWKTKDGIIILQVAVNNTGAGNHGIRKAGRGVISTEHGMITTRAERLSTWT
jgi:hypothetical protein